MTRSGHFSRSHFSVVLIAGIALCGSVNGSVSENAYFEQLLTAPATEATATAKSATQRQRVSKPRSVTAVARAVASEKPEVANTEETRDDRTASLSGGGITWHASAGCVPSSLRTVLGDIVGQFGPMTVSSTCRSRGQNRSAGGADSSYHLSGEAVDFRVHGNVGAVYAYLAKNDAVGGLKHYGGGLFHIDSGPRRSW